MIRRSTRLVAALVLFAALAPPARAAIEITPVTSPGGIEAWLYQDATIPILTIEGSFLGGAALDPSGREGATSLMASLLEEGAGDLDATEFAVAREELAARFGFGASRDDVSFSATMLAENRDAAVDLLRLALTAPRFDPDAIERVRGQTLAVIRSEETEPRVLAGEAFYAQAFPAHPYARPVDGAVETVAAIDAGDLRAAHAAAMTRDRLRLAVVGAITPGELGPLLDRLFAELPATGPALPEIATPSLDGGTTVIDLDVPQSMVVFGHAGIPRDDPDFVPAYVMDHVLGGGGFGSRLTEEMREKRGLTYGVYTFLAPGDFGALYMGAFSSSNARVAEAVDILRAEWTHMAENGVTETELVAAKRYLTGDYPLRFDGNARIADQLLGLQTAGLGIDYVNVRNDLVEAVTVEDIARVARRLLRPEALTTVIAGRPEGLGAGN